MIHMLYFERERNWWKLPQIFSKNSELQCYDLVKKPTRSDFSTTQPQLEYIDYVPTPIDHIVKRGQLTATTVCSMLIRLGNARTGSMWPWRVSLRARTAPAKTSLTHGGNDCLSCPVMRNYLSCNEMKRLIKCNQ